MKRGGQRRVSDGEKSREKREMMNILIDFFLGSNI